MTTAMIEEFVVGYLTSQQQASVSQGRICSVKFACFHTEIEAADQTFYLTQSQYADTGPTSPSADPITPGAWQGSHWSAKFEVTGMTRPRKNPVAIGNRTRDLPLSRLIEETLLTMAIDCILYDNGKSVIVVMVLKTDEARARIAQSVVYWARCPE